MDQSLSVCYWGEWCDPFASCFHCNWRFKLIKINVYSTFIMNIDTDNELLVLFVGFELSFQVKWRNILDLNTQVTCLMFQWKCTLPQILKSKHSFWDKYSPSTDMSWSPPFSSSPKHTLGWAIWLMGLLSIQIKVLAYWQWFWLTSCTLSELFNNLNKSNQ